jgi:hypothetical protein
MTTDDTDGTDEEIQRRRLLERYRSIVMAKDTFGWDGLTDEREILFIF